MKNGLPFYEIGIDLNDPETGVEFNSLVKNPAHEINYQTFSETKVKYEFNDEQQVVTGVAISADTPIYRNCKQLGEHYVVFTKETITNIVEQYSRDGNFNNLNLDHNSKRVVDQAYLIHSYQVNKDLGFTAPERFKDVTDGSWIVSYKIKDKDLYEQIKTEEFNGFSIEGVFVQRQIKMNAETPDEENDLTDDQFNELKDLLNSF